ncbi:MAG: hypothetical protein LBJ92_01810 [Holosporales bacterium]|nr:hypothetical protein [Holosporales bacterium]
MHRVLKLLILLNFVEGNAMDMGPVTLGRGPQKVAQLQASRQFAAFIGVGMSFCERWKNNLNILKQIAPQHNNAWNSFSVLILDQDPKKIQDNPGDALLSAISNQVMGGDVRVCVCFQLICVWLSNDLSKSSPEQLLNLVEFLENLDFATYRWAPDTYPLSHFIAQLQP